MFMRKLLSLRMIKTGGRTPEGETEGDISEEAHLSFRKRKASTSACSTGCL
jgi:hypothetical protein